MDLLATAFPALNEAFALILQPQQIGFLILGVLLGLSIGVFPGLGGIAGLSLALPFVFGMESVSGLALMVGLVAVIPTSDTFASVLMGIPGSSASQATVLDGPRHCVHVRDGGFAEPRFPTALAARICQTAVAADMRTS